MSKSIASKTSVNAYFENDLIERVHRLAELDERTLTWVYNKALTIGVAELEKKFSIDGRPS